MPGSSRGFGIGTRSLGSATDCIENVYGFPKKKKKKVYGLLKKCKVPGPTKSAGKNLGQFYILVKFHLSFCPGGGSCPAPVVSGKLSQEPLHRARRHGKTLPSPTRGGSRRQGLGKKVPRQLQRHPEGWEAPPPSRGATLLPPKIRTCTGKLKFRDSLLFLHRYHRFLSSLDSWLALIWFSFSKDNENSRLPNKKV